MKKIISALIICVLVVGCVCALTGCGGKTLNGAYVLEADIGGIIDLGSTTYEFSGNNVEITYEVRGFEKSIEGTYEITTNEDETMTLTITIESEEEDAEDYAGKHSFVEGKEGDVEYIKIDGVTFKKLAK